MKRRSRQTLELLFTRPVSGSIRWTEIEALFRDLGATLTEREGSRVAIVWQGQVRVFHRPHPSPDTDKGAATTVRRWLEENGVRP